MISDEFLFIFFPLKIILNLGNNQFTTILQYL